MSWSAGGSIGLRRLLKHLITLLDDLQAPGIAFVSLAEGIDATTPAGKLQIHILGAIAEFERERIRERVLAGLSGPGRKVSASNGRGLRFRLTTSRASAPPVTAAVVPASRSTVNWCRRGAGSCRAVNGLDDILVTGRDQSERSTPSWSCFAIGNRRHTVGVLSSTDLSNFVFKKANANARSRENSARTFNSAYAMVGG